MTKSAALSALDSLRIVLGDLEGSAEDLRDAFSFLDQAKKEVEGLPEEEAPAST